MPPQPIKPLDVRGFPPPQPMVMILEAVTWLGAGSSLEILHDRVPHPLYPRLAERGLLVQTRENGDGTVTLIITRPHQP
ncbi:MAG: DUF2249 domain-containing protein [Magnetococcales bacterium]|nr:DUF2249 domain-containing protein [Magnetococcales bacterium]